MLGRAVGLVQVLGRWKLDLAWAAGVLMSSSQMERGLGQHPEFSHLGAGAGGLDLWLGLQGCSQPSQALVSSLEHVTKT